MLCFVVTHRWEGDSGWAGRGRIATTRDGSVSEPYLKRSLNRPKRKSVRGVR